MEALSGRLNPLKLDPQQPPTPGQQLETPPGPSLADLPLDIISLILVHLPLKVCLTLAGTCSSFYNLIMSQIEQLGMQEAHERQP